MGDHTVRELRRLDPNSPVLQHFPQKTFSVWYEGYDAGGRLAFGCVTGVEASTPERAAQLVEDDLLAEGHMSVAIGEINEVEP